ncbi:uncharacterized protein LOC127857448 [Dreissena polymorpha]|uniref:uncharacterized protein LOC127857448 n=1 Tax=Dreissena polymorpha TaxID=45954 RepID=UPI00226428F2|nr:uncharacterized protein LOC127857448 [Dreissena polymorpha]
MYSAIPKVWREDSPKNVTLTEKNNSLVELHIPTITFIAILMDYLPSTYRSLILWLGWIDFIACTVGMPLLIVSMLYPYMFPSEEACKSLRFLHVFFVVASAFIVICIAVERHRRICYPFSAALLLTIISMVIMGVFYFRIGRTIMLSHSTSVQGLTADTKSPFTVDKLESSRISTSIKGPSLRTKQVTLMLLIITGVFVVSFIPHLVPMVTISIKPDFLKVVSSAGVAVYNIFLRSFVINNMADPIIYGFCDKKFRGECASVACNVLTFGGRK